MRHTRDKALVLLGFWRGFRGDELARLEVQYVEAIPGEGMTCYFPQTKGDRQFKGSTFKAPALSRLCPVAAYQAWIVLSGLESGAVFRSIIRYINAKRAAQYLADEGESAPRAARSVNLLPDAWNDLKIYSRRFPSWKQFRRTQWR